VGRPPKTDRNTQVVYDITVSQMTARETATKHSISESRVYQILRDQAQHDVPPDIHMAMHALGLQRVERTAMDIMDSDPNPMFNVKGEPLYHPGTEVFERDMDGDLILSKYGKPIIVGGDPVVDKTERIKAMDMFMRADEQIRKLYARDMPRRQEIILEDQRNESQLALGALKLYLESHPDAAAHAALASRKAIEGTVE
jgi:hypothetical protein